MDNITISEEYVALEDAEYQALLRVARAAKPLSHGYSYFSHKDWTPEWDELAEALSALPEGILNETES